MYQKEGYLNTLKADKTLPGPGQYGRVDLFGKEGRKYTLKSKIKDRNLELRMHQSPGPAAYGGYSYFPQTSKVSISKYKENSGTVFGYQGKRFIEENNFRKLPGPGEYNPNTSLFGNNKR